MARAPGSGPKSRYITPEGHKQLVDELQKLWRVERPQVTQEVADAAALGDRSENAEYIYGKRRLREIDRRLRFLSKRIEELVVVNAPAEDGANSSAVRFGAWVRLEDEEGQEVEYRIVGPDEFDPAQNKISIDAPVGRAVIGKKIGDAVLVRRPKGEIVYTVVGIRYR
jgi:transcription elongation factor GreB